MLVNLDGNQRQNTHDVDLDKRIAYRWCTLDNSCIINLCNIDNISMTEGDVISNFMNDKWIDRIYQDMYGHLELVNKDFTIYKGKINKRSIKLKDGSLSYVHVTADQRWFDRQGMPIDKPKNLITRNDKEEDNKI